MHNDSFHTFVRAKLLEAAQRQRLSDAALARRAGVSVRVLYRLWAGEGVQTRIIARVSEALGVVWA